MEGSARGCVRCGIGNVGVGGAAGCGAGEGLGGRAAARAAEHELRRQHDGGGQRGCAVDTLVQPLCGEHSQLVDRLAHRRHAGAHVPRGHDVVPAHDGDVARHVSAGVLQPGHDREGELVVGADESVGLEFSRQDAVGDRHTFALAEGHPDRLGRNETAGGVRGDEAGIPLADVGGRVGVTDVEQARPPVVEHVSGELLGAVDVLGRDALGAVGVGHALGRRTGNDDNGFATAKSASEGRRHGSRAEHGDGIDSRREVADDAREVALAVREQQDDALAEVGGAGLKAHEQLGVVRTGELREDEPVGLVMAHGEASRGAQRHVVEGLDRLEHLLAGGLGDDRPALQDPRDGRDRHSRLLGDGVDRRAHGGSRGGGCGGACGDGRVGGGGRRCGRRALGPLAWGRRHGLPPSSRRRVVYALTSYPVERGMITL